MQREYLTGLYDDEYAASYEEKFLLSELNRSDTAHELTLLAGLLETASSWLDVACGTGRHLELLRATFPDLAGVDLEPGLLEVARTRLPGVSLTRADMRTFELGRTFDAVTCLFSSVGYLRDPDELAQAISRMAHHLSPGGVLVVDGWVKPDAWLPGIMGPDVPP